MLGVKLVAPPVGFAPNAFDISAALAPDDGALGVEFAGVEDWPPGELAAEEPLPIVLSGNLHTVPPHPEKPARTPQHRDQFLRSFHVFARGASKD